MLRSRGFLSRARGGVGVWFGGIAVLALFLSCVLVFPRLIVRMDSDDSAKGPIKQAEVLQARNDVRGTLLAGLGTLVAVVGGIGTWRLNNQSGQTTERFVTAVDQLGNERVEVRLGGIYALEQVARASPEEQPTISEILSGFVRGHSPRLRATDEQAYAAGRPPTDVQAAITVLARRPTEFDRVSSRLDLSHVDLRGASLRYGSFADAILVGSNLEGADLVEANLSRADLVEANLSGAILMGANLSSAILRGANLSGAILMEANLSGAILMQANLSGAGLIGANLHGADLSKADLSGARLDGANLQVAMLQGANLEGASLHEANMQDANLDGADT